MYEISKGVKMRFSISNKAYDLAAGISVSTREIWFLVLLVAIELLWAHISGITLEEMDVGLSLVVAPVAVGLVLDAMGQAKRIAHIAYYFSFWVGFLIIGSILTYLCATLPFTLMDESFAKMDRAMGFDWILWFHYVKSQPLLDKILTFAYGSMIPQILFGIIFFSHVKRHSGANELWWITMIALVITSLVSGVLPALGTYFYYKENVEAAIHIPHLLALRNFTMTTFPVSTLGGIVTFPSFHMVSVVVLCYPYRHYKKIFPVILTLNSLMLISIPTHGGHYLVDMIAGALVAWASILIYGKILHMDLVKYSPRADNTPLKVSF